MKSKIKKKVMKINLLLGIILLSTGLILELNIGIPEVLSINSIKKNTINLNMVEVDTTYDTVDVASKEEKLETKAMEVTPAQVVPVANKIDTSWGWPTSPNYYITTYYSGGHPAIDIVTSDGNLNIYAASSGVIVTDSYKWDGGNYLVLKQDNGYYSLYCHLAAKSVTTNQRVEKGQVIGTMGRTGLATGVHLHYSIWNGYPYINSSSFNPFNFY